MKDISNQFIVETKQHPLIKICTIILTSIISLYSIIIFLFFITAIFNFSIPFISTLKIALNISNTDIKTFLISALFLFFINYILLVSWKTYNKNKFGNLSRRTPPKPTTKEDILSLNLVSDYDYDKLQNEDVIIFNTNPIKDLY